MSGVAGTALCLLLGLGAWLTVRFAGDIPKTPPEGWDLKISTLEIVKRTMWVAIIFLAAAPVFMGMINTTYQTLWLPFLAGIGFGEILATRWDKRQARLKEARDKARRQERRRKRELAQQEQARQTDE